MQIDRLPWESHVPFSPSRHTYRAGRDYIVPLLLSLAIVAIAVGGLIAWSKLS